MPPETETARPAPSLYEMIAAEAHVELSREENRGLHFTLFLLRGGLCASLADLEHHAGGALPVAEYAAELERRRLVAPVGGGRLALTRFGFDVINFLHRDETGLSRPVRERFESGRDELETLDARWREFAARLASGGGLSEEARAEWFGAARRIRELTSPAAAGARLLTKTV